MLEPQKNLDNVKRADSLAARNAIFALEDYMKTQPQVEIDITHRFAPGVYTREMFVPAGIILTGAIHKTEHISIFLQGRMLVSDGEGRSKEIVAPIVETALPGVKRAGMALDDVRWITIHPTYETDIEKLEDLLVTNDFSEVEHLVDQQDYEIVALEFGITSDVITTYGSIEESLAMLGWGGRPSHCPTKQDIRDLIRRQRNFRTELNELVKTA